MTIYKYLARRKMIDLAISVPSLVLTVAIGVWALPRLDARWGKLEVYGVMAVVIYGGTRLLARRLFGCPNCAKDLAGRMQEIILRKLRACPHCGINFDDPMPRKGPIY